MRGVCISQITHLCGIRPLRVQKWLKNVKLRRCYALRMGTIWSECVFERGSRRLFTAFEKDNVRSVLTTRWEFFYFLFFARLFHQILRYLYEQPKKTLPKIFFGGGKSPNWKQSITIEPPRCPFACLRRTPQGARWQPIISKSQLFVNQGSFSMKFFI